MSAVSPPPLRLRLVVDDREGRSDLAGAVAARWPDVAVGRLPLGDVEIGPRVLVERKTVADLVLSIEDGRLFRQAWGLARAADAPLLIVEGEDAVDAARVAPRALRGVLLSLLTGCRVPLYRTADVEETADVIAQVATQEARRIARLATSRERPAGRVAMDVLSAIPSVGDRRARRLIDTFGSVAAVVAATDEELLDTPEIGPATVRSLRRALGEAPSRAAAVPPSAGDGAEAPDRPGVGCAGDGGTDGGSSPRLRAGTSESPRSAEAP